uniref:Pept_C1 domain-containing protein n=1 Tax=Macrostomum lignano TaxID=282301 RepID=A0A1I8FI05_9PLAT
QFHKDWSRFKERFGRTYEDLTFERQRMEVFVRNLLYIRQHNALAKSGQKTYTLGVGPFADMTHSEFLARMTGLKRTDTFGCNVMSGIVIEIPEVENMYMQVSECPDSNARKSRALSSDAAASRTSRRPSRQALPDTVDWRKKGAVTPVKNQGQCGSCWSFSTTGSLGPALPQDRPAAVTVRAAAGRLRRRSLWQPRLQRRPHGQCVHVHQGPRHRAGVGLPLPGRREPLPVPALRVAANCTGFVTSRTGSEDKLKEAVANVGPVSVAIDASHPSFQHYQSGVYNEPACNSQQLDHGVLVVGYGTLSGSDYWLVKNSWSDMWGEKGYIRMSRNKNNQCGIASTASYPTV